MISPINFSVKNSVFAAVHRFEKLFFARYNRNLTHIILLELSRQLNHVSIRAHVSFLCNQGPTFCIENWMNTVHFQRMFYWKDFCFGLQIRIPIVRIIPKVTLFLIHLESRSYASLYLQTWKPRWSSQWNFSPLRKHIELRCHRF